MTLVAAIEDCRNRKQILPALVLLYSGIDILASLERKGKEGTASAFQRWAKNYLETEDNLGCSANDLYGARCGIVHTFSPASKYSQTGKAREIDYAWGDARVDKLQAIFRATGKNYIALHVDKLIDVFKAGANKFFSDVSNDSERSKLVAKNAGIWFTNMDKALVDNIIDIIEQSPDT